MASVSILLAGNLHHCAGGFYSTAPRLLRTDRGQLSDSFFQRLLPFFRRSVRSGGAAIGYQLRHRSGVIWSLHHHIQADKTACKRVRLHFSQEIVRVEAGVNRVVRVGYRLIQQVSAHSTAHAIPALHQIGIRIKRMHFPTRLLTSSFLVPVQIGAQVHSRNTAYEIPADH